MAQNDHTVGLKLSLRQLVPFRRPSPLTEAAIWFALFALVTLVVGLRALEGTDTMALLLINKGWGSAALDGVMATLSGLGVQPFTWVVLLSWLAWQAWQQAKARKQAAKLWASWVVTLALAVGLADGMSGRLVKPLVGRERPAKVVAGLRPVTGQGEGKAKAYPSSHAANSFAVARVLHAFAAPRWLWWVLALLIALSRVYLGAHFPTDVVGGAFLGLSVGALLIALWMPLANRFIASTPSPSASDTGST